MSVRRTFGAEELADLLKPGAPPAHEAAYLAREWRRFMEVTVASADAPLPLQGASKAVVLLNHSVSGQKVGRVPNMVNPPDFPIAHLRGSHGG